MTEVILGQAITDMLLSFNILGMGSDPIAIAFSTIIAVAVTQGEIFIKQKYSNTIALFLSCYVGFFTVGLATNIGLLVMIAITGVTGIILDEYTEVYKQ